MKKVSVVLILVLVAVFAGAPYVTGKVAESETLKMIEQLNLSASEYGKIDVVSYERGYKSTAAQYRYTPPNNLAVMFPELKEVEYKCESSHGITAIDYQCNLQGKSAYSEFVEQYLDGKDPLSFYGSVSVFGTITQIIALEEAHELDIDGQKFTMPEAKISIVTDSAMQDFEIEGGSSAFTLDATGQRLSVGELNVGGDLRKVKEQLFTGDFAITLDHLAMTDAEGETSYKNIRVQTETAQSGDNLNSSADFMIDEVQIPGDIVSKAEDVLFSADLSGIDTQAMLDYQALATKIQREALAAMEKGQAPASSGEDVAAMLPIFERMLKKGLDVNGELKATLDGKPNHLNLQINLSDDMTLAQLGALMAQADETLKKMNIVVSASMNKELFESQPVIGGMVAQSPLITSTGDNYTLDLSLGKKIELNGKEMTFQELQGSIFSSMPTQ